ncbi:DUF1788 domain-containing protein [Frigidibacter sp. MR17.14]|uniref:DUF1788 domain-containing protein n=1 Tax=Frigidibacter sp. MR17.14 TaxID=3126509 RepID=UPI003012EEF4
MTDLDERLNKILDRITSEDFLSGRNLSGEIPFFAFDYDPKSELAVREHIGFVLSQLNKRRPDLRVAHVNLWALLVDHLKERGLFDKAIEMQREKGDDATLRALRAPLDSGRVAKAMIAAASPADHDLIIVSGVGAAYPLLRTHNLLNNLHSMMGSTPLVLFYPGKYDGQSLKLFGLLKDNPYYRAFRLVD